MTDDIMIRSLNGMPRLTPDLARAVRVREKCRKRLESRSKRAAIVEPVIVGGFCVIYLIALAHDAIKVSLGLG